MRKFLLLALMTFIGFHSTFADRGDIISSEVIRDWDSEEASENYWAIIAGNIPPQDRDSFRTIFTELVAELMVGKRIVSYRVVYKTIDHYGNPTQASGLVILPVHDDKTCEMPIFYYGHGTRFGRFEGPSRPENFGTEVFFVYLASALNFISAAPDYYGMGDGPGFHHHNSYQTNSSSGIDMIRAARNLARQESVGYNSQVYVSGYSEGGHNAMGIIKMVYDQKLRSEFNIMSAGCGSGAFDEFDLQYRFIIDNPYYPTRSYILYILASCEDIYGNLIKEEQGESVSTYLNYPYDSLYNAHLLTQDGNMGWVPLPWTNMFKPGLIESVDANPQHPLRQCLKQSTIYDWPNPFRTSLYYVTTDVQVYWKNSAKAKLAQWKYIPWYRFWDKARIATHDMTNKGQVLSHEEGAIPIMFHYILTANSSKVTRCTENPGRVSKPIPATLVLNYDKSVNIPASSFPGLQDARAVSFTNFKTTPLQFTYDAANASYRLHFGDAQPGAYMLRLANSSGETHFAGLVYDEPNFLEDEQYNPIRQGIDGSWLLDMTLLEDQVSKVVLYTAAGEQISTIEDPYAVQQLAASGTLEAGDYVVEIHGKEMLYHLKLQTGKTVAASSVKLFPNPFANSLVVEEAGATIASVRIFSTDGKEFILAPKYGENRWELNTSSFPAGLYLVQITSSNGTRTEKAVKF